MNTSKFNEEVLYATDDVIHVDAKDIKDLIEASKSNERKRIRLCTHNSVEDSLHEMFIIHKRDTYIRPHKHLNKIESFSVIEGEADVILFDNDGNVTDRIDLGDYASGKKFYQRINDSLFHTLIIRSEVFVFHEVTNGPFLKEQTKFADWAPEENDKDLVLNFMNRLKNL